MGVRVVASDGGSQELEARCELIRFINRSVQVLRFCQTAVQHKSKLKLFKDGQLRDLCSATVGDLMTAAGSTERMNRHLVSLLMLTDADDIEPLSLHLQRFVGLFFESADGELVKRIHRIGELHKQMIARYAKTAPES